MRRAARHLMNCLPGSAQQRWWHVADNLADQGKPGNRNAYDVGRCKPPVHTQFKKGVSGNPRGRPKGGQNLAAALEKELKALITINENGQRKKVTKWTAALRQFVNLAV